jgi:hypothetical protein
MVAGREAAKQSRLPTNKGILFLNLRANLPIKMLPIPTHRSQHARMIPREISFPEKTANNSLMSTTWPTMEENPMNIQVIANRLGITFSGTV